jgi:tetratricopeptide (TPR) repeat protein
MKKLTFTLVLCFIVCITFGQKKAVNDAKSEIKRENPNIGDARAFIEKALQDSETKDKAETWYIAGSVENKQLDMEMVKTYKGEKPNEAIMYPALLKIIPFFEKADSLDQLPDEKGKVKPKHRKDMKAIITANINYYPNAGVYFYNKKDFINAYQAFIQYTNLPDMQMFSDDKKPIIIKTDSSYLQIKYNAAIIASVLEEHTGAIELLESMKNSGYEENDIFRRLTYEYTQLSDSIALLNVLKEGVDKFPGDEYFLLSLVEKKIQSNELKEAAEYINIAIEHKSDDPILFDALGVIYENMDEPEKSIQSYEKALELDPDFSKALKHSGMVYYNLGVKARAAADDISDKKTADEGYAKSIDYFKTALPLFEKAYSIESSDNETIYCLRNIYYTLKMGEEFEKMDAIYNTNNQ